MLILLNPMANNGKGIKKWNKIREDVLSLAKQYGKKVHVEVLPQDPVSLIKNQFNNGKRVFIAAGGDGSVNMVVNALMKLPAKKRSEIIFGAIGLGSSNDFHKPIDKKNKKNSINTIPVKIDFTAPVPYNLGKAEVITDTGEVQENYFAVNSSFGILAEGNHLFNTGDRVINRLKDKWVSGTISYAALKSIATYKNFNSLISIKDENYHTRISNMSIVINPHFTGSLKYDTPVSPQSDYLCVNLCEEMKLLRQLYTFYNLGKGKFTGLPKTRSWKSDAVTITPGRLVPFEMDGEISMVSNVTIQLVKGGLMACQ
ncbi:MAG: hypothetical protein GY754_04560 [bacterium]|nr:hypothetical protein [bacterium]